MPLVYHRVLKYFRSQWVGRWYSNARHSYKLTIPAQPQSDYKQIARVNLTMVPEVFRSRMRSETQSWQFLYFRASQLPTIVLRHLRSSLPSKTLATCFLAKHSLSDCTYIFMLPCMAATQHFLSSCRLLHGWLRYSMAQNASDLTIQQCSLLSLVVIYVRYILLATLSLAKVAVFLLLYRRRIWTYRCLPAYCC